MTALSPLHMLVIWLVAVTVNVVIFSLAFSQPLFYNEKIIIVNCLIAAAILSVFLMFKSLHPAKKAEFREPSPLL